MNKKIVTYRGDPLEEIDNSGTKDSKIYHLDEDSMDIIKSFSSIVEENKVPSELKSFVESLEEDNTFFLQTETRNKYEIYPPTYIAVANTSDTDFPYKVLGTYSTRGLYVAPEVGEDIFLKSVRGHQKRIETKHRGN